MITYEAVNDGHLAAVTAIYAHHVLHSTATFELTPPSENDMRARVKDVLARGLPYEVACEGTRVVGYAYAAPYRLRPAYAHTVEDSIYLHPDYHGQGIGRALLERVIQACVAADKQQMIAVIGDSANVGSVTLHTRLGFRHVGVFCDVGFKFGRYIDTVLMQKTLTPAAVG